MLFMLVDTQSKWPEVHPMKSTVTRRQIISSYRLPEQFVSDNVPQFILDKFATLMKGNRIRHI